MKSSDTVGARTEALSITADRPASALNRSNTGAIGPGCGGGRLAHLNAHLETPLDTEGRTGGWIDGVDELGHIANSDVSEPPWPHVRSKSEKQVLAARPEHPRAAATSTARPSASLLAGEREPADHEILTPSAGAHQRAVDVASDYASRRQQRLDTASARQREQQMLGVAL